MKKENNTSYRHSQDIFYNLYFLLYFRFDANFGQQNVTLSFRRENVSELIQREPKIVRKSNRMEIIL